MGSLGGHIVPGSFFVVVGMWYLWVMLHRYFKSRLHDEKVGSAYKFKSSIAVGFPCSSDRCPLFLLVLASISLTGIIGELYNAFDPTWEFRWYGNLQHVTMYVFYGLAVFAALLDFYGAQIPKDSDYALTLVAFAVEGLLFYNHLHGRHMLDVQIHMALVLVLVATFVVTALEMKHRDSVLASLARCILTLVQGFWFYTVGFMLYPPSWAPVWIVPSEHTMHDRMMLATVLFCMHIAAVVVFTMLLAKYVQARVRCLGQMAPAYELRSRNDFYSLTSLGQLSSHKDKTYPPAVSAGRESYDDGCLKTCCSGNATVSKKCVCG